MMGRYKHSSNFTKAISRALLGVISHNRKISYVKREKLIRRNWVKDQSQWSISTEHEGVYHAARGCQAASLPLTAPGLRGQKKACPVESDKTTGVFAA